MLSSVGHNIKHLPFFIVFIFLNIDSGHTYGVTHRGYASIVRHDLLVTRPSQIWEQHAYGRPGREKKRATDIDDIECLS